MCYSWKQNDRPPDRHMYSAEMKFQSPNWCHSGSGIWSISLMVRHHIPKEYKDIALHLSINEGLPDLQIQAYIGISPRSMRCLRKGKTTVKPVIARWPWLLDALDASVHCILFTYKSIIIPICSMSCISLNDLDLKPEDYMGDRYQHQG